MRFAQNLKIFSDCLSYISGADSRKIYDFGKSRANYYVQTGRTKLEEMRKEIISSSKHAKDIQKVSRILQALDRIEELYDQKDIEQIRKLVDRIAEDYAGLEFGQEKSQEPLLDLKALPANIEGELKEDLSELQKCFGSGCYRASIILCGRMLEIALHHLYFEKTGNDLLETAPGIGLGKVIAKLAEKGIDMGPGINEQVHLINKVRVCSVHKKKEPFSPSREQTHAMILYTQDILNRMFKRDKEDSQR